MVSPERPPSRSEVTDPIVDLVDSVKSYARQETIDPIRGAARWVLVGTLAAASLGIALVMFTLGVLRLSQDLGGQALDGSWSFVHYVIALVVVSCMVAASLGRINSKSLARK